VSRATLVIELGPGRLQGGVLRSGRLTPVHSVTLDPAQWEAAWKDALRPLDAPLRAVLAGIGAPALPATVLHHSPTAVSDVFSCPARRGSTNEAALLALGDAAGFSLDENPSDAYALATDRSGEPRQTHTLIAAETDEASTALVEWLNRAGVRCESIIPMPACHLRSVVLRTLSECAPSRGSGVAPGAGTGARVFLRVGENRSQLAAGIEGRVKLVRHVALDIQTLVDALALPLTVRGPDGTSEVRLGRDEARSILFRIGIPERDTVIDQDRGITGAAVLPALQPVLQRALVEMRQSLRFGLEEPERSTCQFVLLGLGALVPRLGDVLAAQLSLPAALPSIPETAHTDLEEAVAQLPKLPINLLPRRAAAGVGARRVRLALVGGTALALAVGAADAGLTWMQLREASAHAETLRASTSHARKFLAAREHLQERREAIDKTLAAADKAAGASPDWSAWLTELAGITPDGVRLAEITMSADGPQPKCEVRGVVRSDSGRADPIAFIKALQASPLVSQVALGATQRAASGDGSTDFQATISLLALPRTADSQETPR